MASQLPSNPGVHETINQAVGRSVSQSVGWSINRTPSQQVLESVSQCRESVVINLFFPVNPCAPLRFKSVNSKKLSCFMLLAGPSLPEFLNKSWPTHSME